MVCREPQVEVVLFFRVVGRGAVECRRFPRFPVKKVAFGLRAQGVQCVDTEGGRGGGQAFAGR